MYKRTVRGPLPTDYEDDKFRKEPDTHLLEIAEKINEKLGNNVIYQKKGIFAVNQDSSNAMEIFYELKKKFKDIKDMISEKTPNANQVIFTIDLNNKKAPNVYRTLKTEVDKLQITPTPGKK